MSETLDLLRFPLWGSRLIEASAGTGKTWTIAALYVRLVLGHGDNNGFCRPLLPGEILVMTFTRAATRELSDRIRERLIEAARAFRGEPEAGDDFLQTLLTAYPEEADRKQAAHRLALAAEAMDEAAVFTIDAWCQRMLREHAFDSGSLFDEELAADETELFETAVRDYWRQHVYPLGSAELDSLLQCFPNLDKLESGVKVLINQDITTEAQSGTLGHLIARVQTERSARLAELKHGWADKAQAMQIWIEGQLARKDKPFNGRKLQARYYSPWFTALEQWASDPQLDRPDISASGWSRLTPDGMRDAATAALPELPAEFAEFAALQAALDELPELKPALLQHAAGAIRDRLAEFKRQAHTFGFADLQHRLDAALATSDALRERIVSQYPVALIDEFQDTSPLQYRIFDRLYRAQDNNPASALLLIGDPKQSIYAFRGADIHSYLAARRATAGRHYALGTNYRSTTELVESVNRVFKLADGYPAGAFRFRTGADDPLPFTAVAAKGRSERFVMANAAAPALTLWRDGETLNGDAYRRRFAAHCAEQIVALLNDETAGFASEHPFVRLQAADIAVLVRTGKEAAAMRRALRERGIASVYLSDKDSVFASPEAADLLRWLRAIAHPLDGRLARAALATATARVDLAELARYRDDDLAWEARINQLKQLRNCWQRQGVLAMLRQWLHLMDLPARLLAEVGGERVLTNLLHLAELLQNASLQQEGEQALTRWLAEQIADPSGGGDEAIVRLESDADLVKIVTIHKSKGLEYPLVFLPFICSFRDETCRDKHLLAWRDESGECRIDFTLSDAALAAVNEARLQEDLRLLYVALTRPRHALWLGVAALSVGNSPASQLHRSALGYLLAGGTPIESNALAARLAGLQGAALQALPEIIGKTALHTRQCAGVLAEPAPYPGRFERDWSIASFSALTRDLAAPPGWLASESKDEAPAVPAPRTNPQGWHGFPRGPVPGNFLHDQLEWLAGEGFRAEALGWLPERCERLGWGHRGEVVQHWLTQVLQTPLPPLGCALADLPSPLPEMEFWFPADRIASERIDTLCRDHLLGGAPRPPLPERQLHGMLKGFADLVFEHDGKYWVLDYKSNALGEHDAAYPPAALADAMLEHRYDVQAAIYLLALHRLLRQRLGNDYRPQQQLGGALYLFLRGIAAPGNGCCFIEPPLEMLEILDAELAGGE